MEYIRPMEFWKQLTKDIVGADIEDWYWISTEGRIYSTKSNKILKLSYDNDGYAIIGLYYKGIHKQKNFRVNRLVLLAFNPVQNAEQLVSNHLNGIKDENHEFNLEWATYSQNTIHAFNNGLSTPLYGEKNPMAIITDAQAKQVAGMLSEEKYTYSDIVNATGVPVDIVSSINNGRSWDKYYKEYDLENKHNPRENAVFSYYDIHKICKYFEDHQITTLDRSIKEDILKYINYPSNISTRKMLQRIFDKQRHAKISSLYNF